MARWRAANWTRYHQLLTHLCLKGHQVTVLEPPPLTLAETNFIDLDIAVPEGMSLRQVSVPLWRVKTPLQKLVKRALYSLACRSVMRSILDSDGVDAVVLYNLPQRALLRQGPWVTVFDVPDDLPAMLEHELGWGKTRIVRRAAEAVQARMVEQCQVVTTVSLGLQERLGEKAVLLPNGVCLREARSEGREQRLARSRAPVVGYVGAFEYFVDLSMVLSVASKLKEVTFLLVGAGREWEKVRARVEQEGLTNVRLPGPAPHSHIFKYLADMDICLIPFRRTSVSDASCPLKFFEYAGACKPIISTPIREVRRIGKDFVTFVEDAHELRDAIVDLLHAPQKRAFLAERGYATVRQRYNWGALTDEFIALVRAARGGLRHWETMQDSAALWPSQ
jgi:glycosyltransferase involved in cell wall biosynthesis